MTRDTAPRRPFLRPALACLFIGGLGWALRDDGGRTPGLPESSFLIEFGLKDTAEQAWDGELAPATGQVLEVEEHHFRAHEVNQTGFSPKGRELNKLPESRFPSDYLPSRSAWVCSTRNASLHGPTTEWRIQPETPAPILQSPSILVHVRANPGNQPVRVKTVRGEFSFTPAPVERFPPSTFLDGQVTITAVPRGAPLSPGRLSHQDYPSLWISRAGELWAAWQEYDDRADSVLALGRGGSPSVLAEGADVFHTAIAEDGRGRPWVIWSMQVAGNWDLYGRAKEKDAWSPAERLTSDSASDIYHRAVTDSQGRIWLVWQRVSQPHSQIFVRCFEGQRWLPEEQVSAGLSASGNNWWPAIAVGKTGEAAVAWDGYASGNYDVYLRRFDGKRWGEVELVAGTPRFEAHPSVAFDPAGRLFVAWDESGDNWGKDTGFLVRRKGTQLHESRDIRVVRFDGPTRTDLSPALEPAGLSELPHLQVDGGGRVWLLSRGLVRRQPDSPPDAPLDLALWEIHATRYDGNGWSSPVPLPRSAGRNEMMPATGLDARGDLWLAYATDGRSTRSYQPRQLHVELATLRDVNRPALGPAPATPLPGTEKLDPQEAAHVRRVRDYRVESRGKSYRIYRGDLHRHTDISEDGYGDGSLLDAYRYARDAAALEFLGVSDHTGGLDDPYAWWRTQKFADLFYVRGSFATFYGYERSVEYPNGHRNIFFRRRGNDVTRISPMEAEGFGGPGALFAYLRRHDGLSIPHTIGRTSGTDWRDSDPRVENLVELYQGMRDTYEYPGAPRPVWGDRLNVDPSRPVPRASSIEQSPSFRRMGFVWKALDKGHRLGFIASSDHISTHISYACILAESPGRDKLWEAIRARRAYAATDNIVLDARFAGSDGEHLMGEEFSSRTPIRVKVRVVGTGPIARLDLIRNARIIHTVRPSLAEFTFDHQDTGNVRGIAYYYVRALQENGEMAWGSPVWVEYR